MIKRIFWGLVALMVIGIAASFTAKPTAQQDKSSNAPAGTPIPSQPSDVQASSVRSEPVVQNWEYASDQDTMGRGVIKSATTTAKQPVEFGFPYAGQQYAKLQLRQHPKHGKDVLFWLDRGQFGCGIDGCTLGVRFDDGKVQNFTANEPADNSTNLLFISNYERFVGQLRKAKRVQIEAQFFQQGTHVFEFDVSGLKF